MLTNEDAQFVVFDDDEAHSPDESDAGFATVPVECVDATYDPEANWTD